MWSRIAGENWTPGFRRGGSVDVGALVGGGMSTQRRTESSPCARLCSLLHCLISLTGLPSALSSYTGNLLVPGALLGAGHLVGKKTASPILRTEREMVKQLQP